MRLARFGKAGFLEESLDLALRGPVENGRVDPDAELLRGPAGVDFEDLADVHPGGNAEGIEDDIDGRAVGQPGHVLFRHDPGDDALVSVAAGNLVSDRELALHGDVDLDGLDDAGRELVALLQGVDFLLEDGLEGLDLPAGFALDVLDPLVAFLVGFELELADIGEVDLVQEALGELLPFGDRQAAQLLFLLDHDALAAGP